MSLDVRTGVAPISLVDVQTVDGLLYYWSDRPITAPAALSADGLGDLIAYQPWLLTAPTFTFNRSLQTDTGTFTLQNISGDTISPDFAKATRRSSLEGALFVFRWWDPGGEFAWIETEGTLSVDEVDNRTAPLATAQLLAGQDDTPAESYSEVCQLVWGEARCGATGSTECLYSYKTCQVVEHFLGVLPDFEKNFTETIAATATTTVNRRRSL